MTKKTSFIAVCGAPNAGKSTLINCIIGTKVSIVSPKPQTTRENIKGIMMIDSTQLVFIDTPGIMKAKGRRMRSMVNYAWEGIGEADQILFVIDGEKGMNDFSAAVLENLQSKGLKGCAVINKTDAADPTKVLELAKTLYDTGIFAEIFMTSAKKGKGTEAVIEYLVKNAPEQEWLYPADQLSDKNDRFLAEEITREKIFYLTQQEIPYSVDVVTDSYKEAANSVTIHQSIIVPKDSHKNIIIGKNGALLKEIGTKSRLELSKLIGCKVNLFLHVKVREARES